MQDGRGRFYNMSQIQGQQELPRSIKKIWGDREKNLKETEKAKMCGHPEHSVRLQGRRQ